MPAPPTGAAQAPVAESPADAGVAGGTAGTLARGTAELHYTVYGEADESRPLVVLLSGGPGVASDYLVPLALRLDDLARVVVLDQRGTGLSQLDTLDGESLNLDLVVADLEVLRDHLGAERWVLAGHSWGGMLAMLYAAEHPERVAGLVLAASGGPNLDFLQWYGDNILSRLDTYDRALAAWWQDPERMAAEPDRALRGYLRVTAPALTFDPLDSVPLVDHITREDTVTPMVNLLLMGEWGMRQIDLTPRLADVDSPVLVIQGRQDPVGMSTAYQVRDAFPAARLEIFERCGHLPFVEHEERFVELVGDFLTGLVGAG